MSFDPGHCLPRPGRQRCRRRRSGEAYVPLTLVIAYLFGR